LPLSTTSYMTVGDPEKMTHETPCQNEYDEGGRGELPKKL